MNNPSDTAVPERPKKRNSLTGEELEGMDEVIFVDTESGSNFSLNTTAAAILELCDGKRTADEIAALVADTLNGDMKQIRKDTQNILMEFAVYGLFSD